MAPEEKRSQLALVDFGKFESQRAALEGFMLSSDVYRKHPDWWPGYIPVLSLSYLPTPGLKEIDRYAKAFAESSVQNGEFEVTGPMEAIRIDGKPGMRFPARQTARLKDGRTATVEMVFWHILNGDAVLRLQFASLLQDQPELLAELQPAVEAIRFTPTPAATPP